MIRIIEEYNAKLSQEEEYPQQSHWQIFVVFQTTEEIIFQKKNMKQESFRRGRISGIFSSPSYSVYAKKKKKKCDLTFFKGFFYIRDNDDNSK